MKPGPEKEGKLIVPDEATQREVMQLYRQVDRLARNGHIPKIRAGNAVQPQDKDSGLVHREWVRRTRNQGEMAERTLEGEQVKAAWMDRNGQIQHAAGKVIRNEAGELVIESWADNVRQETAVPRDSMVIRKNGVNLRP